MVRDRQLEELVWRSNSRVTRREEYEEITGDARGQGIWRERRGLIANITKWSAQLFRRAMYEVVATSASSTSSSTSNSISTSTVQEPWPFQVKALGFPVSAAPKGAGQDISNGGGLGHCWVSDLVYSGGHQSVTHVLYSKVGYIVKVHENKENVAEELSKDMKLIGSGDSQSDFRILATLERCYCI